MKQTYRPQKSGGKRIFESRFIENLTKTHPYVAISMFILLGFFLIVYSYSQTILTEKQILITYPLGIFLFTLAEYLIHRYIFHMKLTSQLRKKFQYNSHGVHHEFPNDRSRLVMPPLLSLPITIVLFSIFYFIIGKWSFTFLGGFFTGYGIYLFVHYIVHAWKMPKNKFKTLWIYHNIHHYQNEKVAFGVSSHLWDRIFRTMPEFTIGLTNKNNH